MLCSEKSEVAVNVTSLSSRTRRLGLSLIRRKGRPRVFLEGCDPFTCLCREGCLYVYLQPFALDPGAQL